MTRPFLAIACVCLLPGTVSGQCAGGMCPAGPPPHPAVARIVNRNQAGQYFGSGTLVDKDDARGIVVTCAHLFRDGAGEISVAFPDGKTFGAKLLVIDRQWDLAALAIAPPAAPAVAVAADAPRPGDWLTSCGFGPDGRWRSTPGQARGYVQAAGTSAPETLEMSGAARQGDSGGPIFNSRGQLAAVLWGTDGHSIGGTYCGRVRAFLAGIVRRDPRATETPAQPDAARNEANNAADRPSSPDRLTQLGDRLDQIRGRLDRIEAAAQVAANVDSVKIRGIAQQVAGDVLAEAAPAAANAWLPALMAALGWTGPPALAAMLALKLAGTLLRRRVARRRASAGRRSPRAAEKLSAEKPHGVGADTSVASRAARERYFRGAKGDNNDDYARQLAEVYALSGRSATADATLGREYDAELSRAEQSSDAALAASARRIRQTVANRFYRIHADSPLPAEPVSG
jgi:hypothetical protein